VVRGVRVARGRGRPGRKTGEGAENEESPKVQGGPRGTKPGRGLKAGDPGGRKARRRRGSGKSEGENQNVK